MICIGIAELVIKKQCLVREIIEYIKYNITNYACMTCVVEFNVTITCIMIVQNNYTHVITSFVRYIADVAPLICCKNSHPVDVSNITN